MWDHGERKVLTCMEIGKIYGFYAIVEHPRVKLLFFRLGWGPLEIFPGRWLRRKPAITNVPTARSQLSHLLSAL